MHIQSARTHNGIYYGMRIDKKLFYEKNLITFIVLSEHHHHHHKKM